VNKVESMVNGRLPAADAPAEPLKVLKMVLPNTCWVGEAVAMTNNFVGEIYRAAGRGATRIADAARG
jgi:hypothetical protein